MVNKILAIFLIVLIFFLIYALVVKNKKLLSIKKMKTYNITTNNLNNIVSNNYYFSLWYNIHGIKNKNRTGQIFDSVLSYSNADNYDLLKWIGKSSEPYYDYKFISCDDSTSMTSLIYIGLKNNLNSLNIKLNNNWEKTTLSTANVVDFNVNDIPLNGWNNIIVNVNQNIVDVYVNGELRRTLLNNNLKNINNPGSSYLCIGNNNLDGYIGNITFGENSISTKEAFDIYKKGLGENPLKSLINKYRLKFSILEKNSEMNSLEL